jgi:hypothetical protein
LADSGTCASNSIEVVIITAEVEDREMLEKELRGTVFRLKPNADAAYAEWELSQLFPPPTSHVN